MVEYGLVGEGYHRELVATLRREGREGEGAKDYIIAINVTSNFYIDLDQVPRHSNTPELSFLCVCRFLRWLRLGDQM